MQNEDFDAVVIAFAGAVGQGAGRPLSGSAAEYLSQKYIQLGHTNAAEIDDGVHAACCRFFRALGSAAAVHAEDDNSSEITAKHLETGDGQLQAIGLDCPLCPVG